MATRHNVADVSELPPGKALLTEVAGKPVALFNVDGKIFALDNTCPHRGGPLSDGTLVGTTVTCPWHGWQFDCTSGKSLRNPAVCAATYKAEVEGTTVVVEI